MRRPELGRSLADPADIAELGAALNLFPEATHLPAPLARKP
ncbi:hypothetical protein [Amycolatopsis sp. cmx-8-4]